MRQIFIFILLLISQFCIAQQAVSSQYVLLPTELNAGLTGSACGLRLITHFQKYEHGILTNNRFNNYGASLDMPFVLKNGDKIGVGYSYIGEVAGGSTYSNMSHSLSTAYHKFINVVGGKSSYISLGLSAGLVNHRIDESGLRWPSQIGPNGFDPTINPNENFDPSITYPNINLGLAFNGPISNSISTNTGVSIYHVNKPNVSFTGNDTPLNRRLIAYTKFDVMLSTKWSVNPSFYYTEQGINNFYMIGSDCTYHINQKNALSIGGGYGKNKQPYFNASAVIHRMSIGLNYSCQQFIFNKLECIVAYQITTNKCP